MNQRFSRPWNAVARISSTVLVLAFSSSLAATASGCGDDSKGESDAGTLDARLPDAGPDAAAPDGGNAGWDAETDAGQVHPPCLTPLATESPFEMDPSGPDTQIHAAAAFDGTAVWVVYARPDDAGTFDVYGMRANCDTTLQTAPFRINTTDYNDLDPTLAVGQDSILVAWQTDTGTGQDNMQTLVRAYSKDASPLMTEDRMVRTDHEGLPVSGNTWMPALAPLAEGFVLAGARALPDATGFQVYVQRLDAMAEPTEPTMDASPAPEAGQTFPALATRGGGAIFLAFQQALPPNYDDQVVSTWIAAGQTEPSLPPQAPEGHSQSQGPSLATLSDGTVVLAFADTFSRSVILTLAAAESGAPEFSVGENARTDFAPVLAAGPDNSGAVAWYRNQSGIRNEFWVAGFSYDGQAFRLGPSLRVTTEPVPPYQPAIAHVTENIYFLAWSQGTSPAFRLYGIFLEIPPP